MVLDNPLLLFCSQDWKNPARDTEEYRDSILEILSDARVAAPVVQMADLHSAIRQRSYFYVFAHQTTNGDYPQVILPSKRLYLFLANLFFAGQAELGQHPRRRAGLRFWHAAGGRHQPLVDELHPGRNAPL